MEHLIAPVGAGLGVVVLCIGVLMWFSVRRFMARAVRVPGTIVELIEDGGCYFPVIKIESEELGRMAKQLAVGTNPPIGEVGDIKMFLVDPLDPEDIRLAEEHSLYLGVLVVGLAGFLAAAVFGAMWLSGWIA